MSVPRRWGLSAHARDMTSRMLIPPQHRSHFNPEMTKCCAYHTLKQAKRPKFLTHAMASLLCLWARVRLWSEGGGEDPAFGVKVLENLGGLFVQ
jgi:hypothetical protein